MPRQLLQEILLNTDSSPYEDDAPSPWKHISISITIENQSKKWQTSIVFQGRPSRVCPMKSSGTVCKFFQPNFHFQHLVLGINHFHFPLLILTLKRNPRDLWPLRHLIRVMITHDLTQKDLLPTYLCTSIRKHAKGAILGTCNLCDTWSGWWEDMT